MKPISEILNKILAPNMAAFLPSFNEDPKKKAADKEAIRFGEAHGLTSPHITGAKGIPKYIDSSTGKPYIPQPEKKKLQSLPFGVSVNDVMSEEGKYWITDPKTGDAVEIDPVVFSNRGNADMWLVSQDFKSKMSKQK